MFNPFTKSVVRLPSLLQFTNKSQRRSQDVSTHTIPYSTEELSHHITLEQLRQARYSFNLSLVVVAISTIIGFTGAGLLIMGKTTEATVAAAGSVLSTGYHLWLVKEANDRLEKTLATLKEEK